MVSDLQIELEPPRRGNGWSAGFHIGILKKSLPFWQAKPGCYVHRVRSGIVHQLGRRDPHTSLKMWCGQSGFLTHQSLGREGNLLADIPAGEVCCATCEGRAVGAGLLGAPVIAGHPVKYSPRV
jgi:hypothetical protein